MPVETDRPELEPERLESWKEIARYCRRGVTTVQRWEIEEGLPVHRHQHAQRGTVFAYPAELDEWAQQRKNRARAQNTGSLTDVKRLGKGRAVRVGLVAAPLAVVLCLLAWKLSRSVAGDFSSTAQPISFSALPGVQAEPDVSPAGDQIAFAWEGASGDNLDIYVMAAEGGRARRITDHPAAERSPTWSPKGNRIAFTRQRDATSHSVIVLDLNRTIESEVAVIENGEADGDVIDWAPNGRDLMVSHRPPGQRAHRIELLNMRGERHPLTEPHPDSNGDTQVSVSPDGQTLAIVRDHYYQRHCNDLLLHPLDGGEPRWVTRDYGRISGVAWLPDSRSVVFSSTRAGNPSLWSLTLEQGDSRPIPQRLTDGRSAALNPSVSARASGAAASIIYQSRRRYAYIHKARLDPARRTVRPTQVTDGEGSDIGPALSPDGRQILFTSNRSGLLEIWLTAGGGPPRRLTTFNVIYVGGPRWSPDGSELLFTSMGNIYRTIAGKKVFAITDGDWNEGGPSWSADGRHIYYSSNRSGSRQVWRQSGNRLDQARQITRNGARDVLESLDGKTIYFTRDDNVAGLWSMPVDGGPEKLAVEGEVYSGHWGVARDGIYYLFTPEDPGADLEVRRYSFTSRETQTAAVLEGVPAWSREPGFSVTADGVWVAFAASTARTEDLLSLDVPALP